VAEGREERARRAAADDGRDAPAERRIARAPGHAGPTGGEAAPDVRVPVPDRPMVRGRDVFLRPAERADLPDFVRWLNEADMTAGLTTRAPLSLPLEERWFEGMLEHHGRDTYHFVICLLADGRAIGVTSLFEIDTVNGQAGFGIFIGDESMRNRGYGTDALAAIVDFGFGELRLERIWLDVFTDNPRAKRSYEKAGFTLEGTFRRAWYRRGRYLDSQRMALLRSEWAALARPKSWEIEAP
jgi:RimJ/RimL family protein N-acetyltransferase